MILNKTSLAWIYDFGFIQDICVERNSEKIAVIEWDNPSAIIYYFNWEIWKTFPNPSWFGVQWPSRVSIDWDKIVISYEWQFAEQWTAWLSEDGWNTRERLLFDWTNLKTFSAVDVLWDTIAILTRAEPWQTWKWKLYLSIDWWQNFSTQNIDWGGWIDYWSDVKITPNWNIFVSFYSSLPSEYNNLFVFSWWSRWIVTLDEWSIRKMDKDNNSNIVFSKRDSFWNKNYMVNSSLTATEIDSTVWTPLIDWNNIVILKSSLWVWVNNTIRYYDWSSRTNVSVPDSVWKAFSKWVYMWWKLIFWWSVVWDWIWANWSYFWTEEAKNNWFTVIE